MKNNDILNFDRLQFGRNQVKYFVGDFYTLDPTFIEKINYGFYLHEDGTARYLSYSHLEIDEDEFYKTFFLKKGFALGEYSTTCHNLFYCQEGKPCHCGSVKEWKQK